MASIIFWTFSYFNSLLKRSNRALNESIYRIAATKFCTSLPELFHLKFIADYFEFASECKLPSRSSEHPLNMQPTICVLQSYCRKFLLLLFLYYIYSNSLLLNFRRKFLNVGKQLNDSTVKTPTTVLLESIISVSIDESVRPWRCSTKKSRVQFPARKNFFYGLHSFLSRVNMWLSMCVFIAPAIQGFHSVGLWV